MRDIEIIEREIGRATVANPVTSTRLIEAVYEQTGKTVTARQVRLNVAYLREKRRLNVAYLREKRHLPVLATKREPRGYYMARNVAEINDYEVEIRAHALRELRTISLIKSGFFGQKQIDLPLL